MRYAREAGRKNCNGFYMLVAQALAAEEIWLESEIDQEIIASIVQEMQGA
jgi:shikimate dehydrogenase